MKSKLFLLITAILVISLSVSVAQTPKSLNIVFIGNSITHGANLANPEHDAPPVAAAAWLQQQHDIRTVAYSNQGHSGFTTVDFLPSTGTTFKWVKAAASNFMDKQALLIFSIKLGTNDSAIEGPNGSPVSPDHYKQNLKTIADSLLKEFPACIIIFQHPIWYSPNTYNGAKYLQEGLDRLQSYIPQIDQLVADYATTNPKRIFTGDTEAFGYFKQNYLTDLTPEDGHQGTFYLHPNKKGAAVLGEFWGKAIYKVVKSL